MPEFEQDEYAIVSECYSYPSLIGREVQIIQGLHARFLDNEFRNVYKVDTGEGFVFITEQDLDKLPHPNLLTAWYNCIWQPEDV